MALLDSRSVHRWHDQIMIQFSIHLSPISSGQTYRDNSLFLGLGDGFEYIGRISACGNSDEHIARHPESFHLFGEYFIKAVIIPNRSKNGSIRSERDSWK